jgi:hypothetical protein
LTDSNKTWSIRRTKLYIYSPWRGQTVNIQFMLDPGWVRL